MDILAYHVSGPASSLMTLKGILPPVSVHEERVANSFRHHNPSTPVDSNVQTVYPLVWTGRSKYEKEFQQKHVPLRSLLRHEGKPEEPYRLP